MNETENTPRKSFFPLWVRIVALILAILLIGEIIFSRSVAVNFSSRKYADTDYEHAAEYIEQNDSYLTAGTLSRMRAAASMLGEPKTYEQFSLFASVAIADEDYAKAADYLLRAAEVYEGDDKGLAALYIKVGCLNALDGSWSTAASRFEKAIQLDDTDPSAWLMLCETNLNLGNYEKALSDLETYSTFTELSDEEFDALIQLQISLEKYDDALSSCQKAEETGRIPPADIALYRAQISYMQGDYEKCMELARSSIADGGDPARCNSLIALCCESTGDYKAALAACLELIDKGQADLTIYQQAAQDAYLTSDYENVIRVSEEALEKFGESDETLVFKKWLGLSYFETNDLANAEKNLTAMIDSGETMPELNYLRGVCEMGDGKYEEAVSDFTASLVSEDLYDEALYNRGLCYIKLGDTDAAAVDFQEVIDRDEDEEIIAMICELLGITPEQLEASRRNE